MISVGDTGEVDPVCCVGVVPGVLFGMGWLANLLIASLVGWIHDHCERVGNRAVIVVVGERLLGLLLNRRQ